jgi:hypothetical protein
MDNSKLNSETAFTGFKWGLILGIAMGFFKGPRLDSMSLSQKISEASNEIYGRFNSDSINVDIEQGKRAAQSVRKNFR